MLKLPAGEGVRLRLLPDPIEKWLWLADVLRSNEFDLLRKPLLFSEERIKCSVEFDLWIGGLSLDPCLNLSRDPDLPVILSLDKERCRDDVIVRELLTRSPDPLLSLELALVNVRPLQKVTVKS